MRERGERLRNIIWTTVDHTVRIGEDIIEADASGGAIEITLYPGDKLPGSGITIKRMNVGLGVSVIVEGGKLIDGAVSKSLLVQYSSLTLYARADGNWGVE
jgi:hypothetical protein